MARSYQKISGALNPDGGTFEVFLEESVIRQAVNGPGARFHNMRLMKEVLEKPHEVHLGLRDPEDQDHGLAYVGYPDHALSAEGETRPMPKGMAFIVFMTKNRFVYDWRWDVLGDPALRFPGGRTWPKS